MQGIFLFFIFWRIADFVISTVTKMLHLANSQFSFGFQPDHIIPYLTPLLVSFANFDGAHYLHIAHDGYMHYEQTFFPLYPLLIHLLTPIIGSNELLAGFIIANTCFFFGLYFFKKYLELIGKESKSIFWILLFLLCFPTSFFFGAIYTEGLFFLLVTTSLYFAQKKQYGRLISILILAALTRLMGVFLALPILSILANSEQTFSHLIKTQKKAMLISLTQFIGLGIYMLYLQITTGDALSFYHSQSAFQNGRSTNHLVLLPQVYYRYLRILFTASHDVTYFVAAVEFVLFTLFLLVLLYDLWKLWKEKSLENRIGLIGLNLFSLINLILPSLTGTLTSTPRYVLLSLSFFIRIAEIKNLVLKISLLFLFLIFHVILLSLFIQGYFVS